MDGLSTGLEQIAAQTRKDGAQHDLTMVFESRSGGLTIHCSPLPTAEAAQILKRHGEYRNYLQCADAWFGLLARSDDGMPKIGMELRFPREHDDALDEATKGLAAHSKPVRPHCAEDRSQRALPMRQRKKIQEVPYAVSQASSRESLTSYLHSRLAEFPTPGTSAFHLRSCLIPCPSDFGSGRKE